MERLLVVDDDAGLRDGISRYFSALGYVVDRAAKVAEAKALLAQARYDAVITDLHLTPGEGAEGLAVVVEARRQCSAARIVLLTGTPSDAVETAARRLGVDVLLQKPRPLPELASILHTLAGRGRLQEGSSVLTPESLSIVFQTMFQVGPHGRHIHAVEALVRGQRAGLESPAALFEAARSRGQEELLDRACVAAALIEARRLPTDLRLCVNVHASSLAADDALVVSLAAAARQCSISAERLVVEVVDHVPVLGHSGLRQSIEALRAMGVRIALDQTGPASSDERSLRECRPDYLKVHASLAADPGRGSRAAALASVCALAREFGARVVAEGIERSEQLDLVTGAGIDLVQGFLLAPPLGFHHLAHRPFFAENATGDVQRGGAAATGVGLGLGAR